MPRAEASLRRYPLRPLRTVLLATSVILITRIQITLLLEVVAKEVLRARNFCKSPKDEQVEVQ